MFKPAPPHNPLKPPGICLCVDCSRLILQRRCPSRSPDGYQCGDFKGHRGEHTILVCTTFQIAAERVASAGRF